MAIGNITLRTRTSFAWQSANLGRNPEERAAIFARFWSHVNRPEAKACWLFAGDHGCAFEIEGEVVSAAEFAWFASRGATTQEVVVCHRCGVPACVNPSHLYLGTRTAISSHLKQPQQACKVRTRRSKFGQSYADAQIRLHQGELIGFLSAE